MIDEQTKEWCRKVFESSHNGIKHSAMFLSIFTENYEKAPECFLQLGIAVMYDKPLVFLIPEDQDVRIPETLKKIAFRIEKVDFKDQERMKQIMVELNKELDKKEMH